LFVFVLFCFGAAFIQNVFIESLSKNWQFSVAIAIAVI